MIRKLMESDRGRILKYLSKDAAFNLFIIGDIEVFGFDKEFMEVWEMYDESDETQGVLLRFYESFIPYYHDKSTNISEFLEIIKSYPVEKQIVSGKKDIVDRFKEDLDVKRSRTDYFSQLTHKNNLDLVKNHIKIANSDESSKIHTAYSKIKEFEGTGPDEERMKARLSDGTTRLHYIEVDNGEVISMAQSTAESSSAAMIIGVATLEEHRGKGHVSQCMSHLSKTILDDGKTLCLFYDNPKAGKIYHRLGFENIGKWEVLFR